MGRRPYPRADGLRSGPSELAHPPPDARPGLSPRPAASTARLRFARLAWSQDALSPPSSASALCEGDRSCQDCLLPRIIDYLREGFRFLQFAEDLAICIAPETPENYTCCRRATTAWRSCTGLRRGRDPAGPQGPSGESSPPEKQVFTGSFGLEGGMARLEGGPVLRLIWVQRLPEGCVPALGRVRSERKVGHALCNMPLTT